MIDTHAHLDDPQYTDDFALFMQEQKAAGVEAIVIPATNATSVQSVLAVCAKYPNFCFPALGIHPEEVHDDWQQQFSAVEDALTQNKCIAVGEIGLDYHWDKTYKEQQQQALTAQLELALKMNLPVLLHNRESTEDMLQILAPYAKRGLRGVMHCFTGSIETAIRILDMGLYLGIGGVLTFKNTHLPETLKSIPLERIVLETDAPYMSPVPFRGKRNEPRFIKYVIERLSQVYEVSENEIEQQTTCNARALLNL